MKHLKELLEDIKSGHLLKVTHALSQEFTEASASPEVWSFAARHLQQAGYSDLSHAVYQRLLQAGFLTQDVAYHLIKNALAKGDREQAAEVALRLLARNPQADTVGTALAPEVGDAVVRALIPVDPAIALALSDHLHPHSPEANLLRVDALRELDRLRDALAMITGPLDALIQSDARFLSRRARLREQLGDWQQAYSDWQTLLDDFGDSQAGLALIRILQRQEREDEMPALLARAFLHIKDSFARLQIAVQIDDPALADLLLGQVLEACAHQRTWDEHTRQQLDECKETLVSAGYLGMALYIEQVDLAVNGIAADQTIREVVQRSSGRVVGALLRPAPLNECAQIFAKDVAEKLIRHGIADHASSDREHDLTQPATQVKARPKIMLVNATLAAGGAERQFLMFVESLIDRGIPAEDLHICLFSLTPDRGHDHFLPWLESLNVPFTDLSKLSSPKASLDHATFTLLLPRTLRQDVIRLKRMVQHLRPEILHGWQDRSSLAAAWAGQENHVRQIVMSARNMQPAKRKMQLDYAQQLMQAFLAFENVKLTANSHAGARDYEDWLGLETSAVTVMLNALNADRIPLQPAPVLQRDAAPAIPPMHLGGVFRFAHNKRPLLWLDVLKGLKDRADFPVQGILIGSGPLKAQARAHAEELGLMDNLEWREPRSDPADIYAGMTALLLASRVEGTPNVVLEAQASGLPVAAFDVGGVKEAVLQHEANATENDNLLLHAGATAEEVIELMLAWWPRVCQRDPAERRRKILAAYDSAAAAHEALQLYGIRQAL